MQTGETQQPIHNRLEARQRLGTAPPGPCCRRSAALVAAIAGAWLAMQAGTLAAQTSCPKAAPLGASFSVSCAAMTCTFTNTSFQPPSGFTGLEWDFGDGNFTQGPPASTSPISYTYQAGGFFLVTMTLTAGDGQVAVATGGVMLGGAPVPLASDDAFTTPKDTPLTIAIAELLSNDLPGVTFYQATRCALSPAGDSCTYTPPPGFVGVDSFTYSVRDALGNQGSATVTITVTQPLVANPDFFSTFIGVPIPITSSQLLQNDQPTTAVFIRAENPVNGTLSFVGVNAQGAAVYQFTPTGQTAGAGGFDYLISLDGNPPYEMGFVTITVTDSPPKAAFTVQCVNRTCTVHTTSSDDVGITKYVWDWGDGTVVQPTTPYPWADQTHTYSASGRYTITLTVTDTAGQTGSLGLSVLANTPPVAVNDTATTERDLPVTIYVLANDTDADGDALSIANVTLQNPGAFYQVVPNGSSWAIKITPPDSFVGTMTFTYQAYDRWGAASTATVTLTVTQWSVIVDALGDQFACAVNGSLRIPLGTLLANDYDSAGAPLTIVAFDTSVLMGTLDCTTETTACTYRPPPNAYGYTFFRYTVSDPAGRKDTATVKLYVGTYGHPPTAYDDSFTTTMNTPKAFTIQDIVQNDVDADGDTLTVALQTGPTPFGSISCSTPMYTCTYTPNHGFVGADRFPYTASDSINPASTASINMLTLPPATPTFDAQEDVIVTGVNQSAFFSNGRLTSNDYAPSGGPITVTAIDTTGLLGQLSCDSFGCTYNPPFYFQGTTTFKYTASDGHGATDTAIVKIWVGGTNHPPVAQPDTLTTAKNTALRFSVFDLLRNDYDPDDDPLSVTVYPSTAHLGALSCGTPNYWCVYTPNAGATGADVITYLLSDGTASVTSTVTINITP